jgi:acetyl-CoA synthetase (ADP-forming)
MPTLSEAESKRRLGAHGIAFPDEREATTVHAAVEAADALGYPVVAKLGGATIAHKSDRGLVRLSLRDAAEVEEAAAELLAAAGPDDGEVHVLVAPMVEGAREVIAGLHRDEQFGMTVMLGIGGIFTEALADVAFRLVPITRADAHDMIDDLRTQALLGPVRGEPAVDREALASVLVALSDASVADPTIRGADLNPLVVAAGTPVPVDALVEIEG